MMNSHEVTSGKHLKHFWSSEWVLVLQWNKELC